jgi:hypothetical protein
VRKKSSRRRLDQYFTPELLLRELLRRVTIHGSVIEPCNGKGALTQSLLREHFVESVTTNDIDPALFDWNETRQDATNIAAPIWQKTYDWCVTNPPYNIADLVLRNAWERCNNVAFLLRLSFIEPTNKRAALLQELTPHLAHLIIFGSPRPSFTENGRTDNVTTMWMIWRKENILGTRVVFVSDWKKA